MFAVGFSTRVVSSAPRRSRGAELLTSVESPTANTAPRIGNSFSNSLNIHDLEGIEPFVVFEKKKASIDARLNNMGEYSHNLVHLYMHVFDGETIWQGVEHRRGFEKNTKVMIVKRLRLSQLRSSMF